MLVNQTILTALLVIPRNFPQDFQNVALLETASFVSMESEQELV